MQAVLDAISSPRRREILRLVWEQELSAGDIASRFDISWPAVSQNLAVLRKAGLVTERQLEVIQEMWTQDLSRLQRAVVE